MESDERFVPTARFKRARKDVKPRSDERFARFLDSEASKPKSIHRIDPFGRPIGDVAESDVLSSDEESEDVVDSPEASSEAEAEAVTEQIEYGDASNRLAVVGCDWDNISAADLFMLFETMYRSLTSKTIRCVTKASIYLSDFGKERIEAEKVHGPQVNISSDVREEELDDAERHEALRKYQQDRSRYYYGIVEFQSEEQAKLLYDEMDGVEAYFAFAGLDLRFVPNDLTFERSPASECVEMPNNYEPPVASESAFRHSRVECKWDMPSMKRTKTLTRRFKESDIQTLDLKEYLASDDEEVDVSEYKSLLQEKMADKGKQEKTEDGKLRAKIGNYTISFGNDADIPEIEEPLLASGSSEKESKRPKARGKKHKKGRGEEAVDIDDTRDFDARLSREQQPGFEGDFDDSRFQRVMKDPDFAIDTRHPKYRNTEFNKKLLRKKAQIK